MTTRAPADLKVQAPEIDRKYGWAKLKMVSGEGILEIAPDGQAPRVGAKLHDSQGDAAALADCVLADLF